MSEQFKTHIESAKTVDQLRATYQRIWRDNPWIGPTTRQSIANLFYSRLLVLRQVP